MRRTRRLVIVLALTGLVAAACGDAEPGAAPTTPTAPTTTTVPLPPGGRQPTPEEPLRVTFGGDSVMAEFASGMIAALEGGGATDARFLLAPSLARAGESTDLIWRREIEQEDPELVVVLVGFWERSVVGDEAFAQPDFGARYRDEVVERFLDIVTAGGARVLWIGMPAVRNTDYSAQFVVLNRAYEQAALARDDVDYLSSGQFLSGPEGGYLETDVSPVTGQSVRLRRTDGLHLCPAGIVRLGDPVLTEIVAQWNVPVAYGWQIGDWREPPHLDAPEECPAPT